MDNYVQGSSVRISAIFENNAHAPADPTTITAKIKNPAGVTTVYVYPTDAALVKDSVGMYHFDISADTPGVWSYRFEGTGAVKAASQDQVYIIPENP